VRQAGNGAAKWSPRRRGLDNAAVHSVSNAATGRRSRRRRIIKNLRASHRAYQKETRNTYITLLQHTIIPKLTVKKGEGTIEIEIFKII